MNGYLDEAIRPLVFITPKMSGYVKPFKLKDGDKDRSNKLMSFCIDDENIFKKYKAIWTRNDDLKNIELTALPIYDDRYIKTNVRTNDIKFILIFLA